MGINTKFENTINKIKMMNDINKKINELEDRVIKSHFLLDKILYLERIIVNMNKKDDENNDEIYVDENNDDYHDENNDEIYVDKNNDDFHEEINHENINIKNDSEKHEIKLNENDIYIKLSIVKK